MGAIGKWLFIAGLIIAALAGLGIDAQAGLSGYVPMALAILGLIVGLLNVGSGESNSFLIAAIGLMLSASAAATLPVVGGTVSAILQNIVAFIAAATLVVALKSLFETASD